MAVRLGDERVDMRAGPMKDRLKDRDEDLCHEVGDRDPDERSTPPCREHEHGADCEPNRSLGAGIAEPSKDRVERRDAVRHDPSLGVAIPAQHRLGLLRLNGYELLCPDQKLLGVERLAEEALGSVFCRLGGRPLVHLAAEHDHRNRPVPFL